MLEMVEELVSETGKVASAPLWPLSDTDVISSLQLAHRWQQSLALLTARLVSEVELRGIPAADGHRSLTGWLGDRLRLDRHPTRELIAQAGALRRRPAVEQALMDGLLDMRQAVVIADAVNAIPVALDVLATETEADAAARDVIVVDAAPAVGVDAVADLADAGVHDAAEIAADAEVVLIGMASRFPAYQLRHLGARILAHVAPQIADRADEAALRREEARSHARRSFTLSPPVNGMVRVTGNLDVEAAAIIQAALQPLCVPASGDDRTAAQRRADALVDVCRLALRTGELPDCGGEPPQVAVTMRFDTLASTVGAAELDNGERMSAMTARRLACDARILPIVLGGAGQVLDVGRGRRLAAGVLRRALVARDRGCAFPGCDRPPRWCDAHHLRPWSQGGPTCLDNLILLCRHHHRVVHDPAGGWRVRLGASRLPEFIPPPWIDLLQRPQRNLYHLRT